MVRKNLGVALSIVLTIFMVFGSVVSPLSGVNVYAAGVSVYIDGVNGNDSNDGSSAGSAVKSWDKARTLLGTKEGTIFVAGTVTAEGNISTQASDKQSVKRADGFNGVMFEVPGSATFYNIDVDGQDKKIDEAVIMPNEGATVYFLKGAVFHNIGYSTEKNPWNYEGGIVLRLVKNIKIKIDGAVFRDNKAKGIFYTALENDISPVTLEMSSGEVRNNDGYFYHNESDAIGQNYVYIYNALIRNNDASSDYRGDHTAIWLCNQGRGPIRSVEGAAIFDNNQYDLMNVGDDSRYSFQGEISGQDWTHHMLGGGNSQWEQGYVSNQGGSVVFKAKPSEADKQKAIELAKSIFEDNNSQIIHSNGTVQFGHYEGAQPVLPTPEEPTEPETPTEPENPTPDEPTNPETPTEPENPTPDEPTNPETPEEPENPTPDEPTEPETPTEPENPTPDEPTEPETPAEETVSVSISKTDMYGTEIEGAVIVIKDAEGKEVLSWTSDKNVKSFEVAPGVYTLEETNAPEGYLKVETAIEFEVAADGTVTVLTTAVDPAGACEVIDGVLVLKDELVPEEDSPEAEEPTTDEVTPTGDEPGDNSDVKTEYVPPAEISEEGEVLGAYDAAKTEIKTADSNNTKSGSKTEGAKTGDSNELVLYLGMIMMAGLSVSALFIRRRKAEK